MKLFSIKKLKNKFFGFSMAEAMTTLLIVSIIMACSAPIITRNVKRSSSREVGNGVPSGAVMYFMPGSYDGNGGCPGGWTNITKKDSQYAGRYIRIAGSYSICGTGGENEKGECQYRRIAGALDPRSGTLGTDTVDAGAFQGSAMPRLTGRFPGTDADIRNYMHYWYPGLSSADKGNPAVYYYALRDLGVLDGVFSYLRTSDIDDENFPMKSGWEDRKWGAYSENAADKYNEYTITPGQPEEVCTKYQYNFKQKSQVKTCETNCNKLSKTCSKSCINNRTCLELGENSLAMGSGLIFFKDPQKRSFTAADSFASTDYFITKFDNQDVTATAMENRPKSVGLVACVKN